MKKAEFTNNGAIIKQEIERSKKWSNGIKFETFKFLASLNSDSR